jgi:hypothetical protein
MTERGSLSYDASASNTSSGHPRTAIVADASQEIGASYGQNSKMLTIEADTHLQRPAPVPVKLTLMAMPLGCSVKTGEPHLRVSGEPQHVRACFLRKSRQPAHARVARRPRLACFRSSPPVQRPDARLPPQMPLPELELARPPFRRVSPVHRTTPST